jgi:glucan 1,3-beta-glucosidase
VFRVRGAVCSKATQRLGQNFNDMSVVHEAALHIPFTGVDDALLPPPVAPSMVESGFSSPRDSYAASQAPGTPPSSARLIDNHDNGNGVEQSTIEKAFYAKHSNVGQNRKSFPLRLFSGLVAFIVIALAVVLPVYFVVIRPKQHHTNNATPQPGPGPGLGSGSTTSIPGQNQSPPSNSITGGDGSLVITSNGSKFTYRNSFGGFWIADPSDPFNNGARAQSWVPALNETWTFGKDLIHG